MTELQKAQLEMLKEGQIFVWQIDEPTDEMKWWAVENGQRLGRHEPNKEMILRLLQLGRGDFKKELVKGLDIPEEIWLEGIENCEPNMFALSDFFGIIIDYANITENIAMKMCKKHPIYYNDEKVKSVITEDKKQEISDVFFNGVKNGVDWHWSLCSDLPISEEQWTWIVDTNYLSLCTGRVETYIKKRNDTPEFVRHHVLKNDTYLKDWGPISKDDLIFWLKTHKDNMDEWRCKESIKYYIQCDDMESVMRECGWFIKYWKNQSAKLCKAAVECDPHNIQYIKKPSDKIALLALSLDRSVEKYLTKTKAVCKYLDQEYKKPNPYPSKYYLVKFDENLCDESNIIKVCIVKGKDMTDFLNLTTSLSFGNLYDDEELEVKEIASYQPITEEEIAVLKKFGLDDLTSGYFHNLD